jgi:UDP-N-acetylglucosamine:LPS N-acetylglucosamine transferase
MTRGTNKHDVDVLLVCSTGGHLQQMLALRGVWGDYTRVWVTFDKSDSRSLLHSERVVHAFSPTNRSMKNLVRNLLLAWTTLRRVQPKMMITTGAGVAVPFAWIARLRGVEVVYIESFTRIEAPSLSCRLIAPVAKRVYAQWPELTRAVPKARYAGNVFANR